MYLWHNRRHIPFLLPSTPTAPRCRWKTDPRFNIIDTRSFVDINTRLYGDYQLLHFRHLIRLAAKVHAVKAVAFRRSAGQMSRKMRSRDREALSVSASKAGSTSGDDTILWADFVSGELPGQVGERWMNRHRVPYGHVPLMLKVRQTWRKRQVEGRGDTNFQFFDFSIFQFVNLQMCKFTNSLSCRFDNRRWMGLALNEEKIIISLDLSNHLFMMSLKLSLFSIYRQQKYGDRQMSFDEKTVLFAII